MFAVVTLKSYFNEPKEVMGGFKTGGHGWDENRGIVCLMILNRGQHMAPKGSFHTREK